MKTLLSVFDYSGTWSAPFLEAGWNVVRIDQKIQNPDNFSTFNIDVLKINPDWLYENIFDNYGTVDGCLFAPPCTDFAVSGAKHWKKKDSPVNTLFGEHKRLDIFIELVYQCLRIVDVCDPDFYSLENPVGRINTLVKDLGKGWFFNPYEFAGYLNPSQEDLIELERISKKNGKGITDNEYKFILEKNAYTKKTGLWGDFNRNLIKKPIQPVKGAPSGTPLQRHGGKSSKTKEARSNTPRGFALAYYEANKDYKRQEIT